MIKLYKKNNGNNINILDKKECTGCSVCAQVCPHNCIKMIETKEGFHYPVIDEKLCTDCGLCVKKCHALNDNFKTDFNQEFYDVRASDEIRMKSSSGGMFTLIADYVFENNGFVCGASWRKDWLGVEHIIIDNKKDLDKLRGSKYVESSLGNIFSEIKKLLNDKKLVLFSGTPCQVSALNFYLGRDYENLITVDLLCNSVVPQKVWRKYLLEKFNDTAKIEYISFRDKKALGWLVGCFLKSAESEYIDKKSEDFYMRAFLEHISCKEECIRCKYRKFERAGDITIGDYWGVADNDDKGVSLVLVNSLKGKSIFEKINQSNFNYKRVYNISNGGLGGNVPIFASRKYFFDNLDKEDFETLYNNSNNPKYNVAIANMLFQNNFGAILTVYALYKIIEDFGYNPLIIYNNSIYSNNLFADIRGNKFALKYMNIANRHFNKYELEKLNEKCDNFVVGSDQVWRVKGHSETAQFYFLNFAYNFKNKIAYSSSFGINYFEGELKDKILFKYYLKQFDKVSVREDDGVKICKEDFDVSATHVLDPVFLINDYDYLINKSNKNINHKFIAVYSLYTNIENELNFISNKLNLDIEYLIKDNEEIGIEDWLWTIKNSELLITDSFHGSCFAIIFNKPFVCILNEGSGISRLESLSNMFDIKTRIISDLSEVMHNTDFLLKMDWTEINKKLEIEKVKSLNWLKNALENKKEKYNYRDDIINYLIEENNEKESEIHYLRNYIDEKQNWIKLFGIYNTKDYLMFYLFGIKISLKINEKNINKLAWWIPVRKWRDNFRSKFFI